MPGSLLAVAQIMFQEAHVLHPSLCEGCEAVAAEVAALD
jgi:hypothetical protein